MEKEKIAHDLTLFYLLINPPEVEEGEFVGQYFNTKNRIMAAMPNTDQWLHVGCEVPV